MHQRTALVVLTALLLARSFTPALANPAGAYPPPASKAANAVLMWSSRQCSIWMANDHLAAQAPGVSVSLWRVEGELQAAQCLIGSNHLDEARALLAPIARSAATKSGAGLDPELQALVLWKYALLEERRGDLTNARRNIGLARDISTSQRCAIDQHIRADYERLEHINVARDLAR
jgi:hypothetical protein